MDKAFLDVFIEANRHNAQLNNKTFRGLTLIRAVVKVKKVETEGTVLVG